MSTRYQEDIRRVYDPAINHLDLYRRMRDGDSSARNTLINSCLPLVYDLAKKFHINNKHVDLADLIQHGNLALIKAVDNWDAEKANITTVATYYVRNALIDMIKESKYSIKTKYDMSKQAYEDISKIKNCGERDVDKICMSTKLKKKRVKMLLSIMESKRIDYSLLNMKLHNSENYESVSDAGIDGCLADVEHMLEKIENKKDAEIFSCWIETVGKNGKSNIVAERLGCSPQEVLDSVKKTKRTLKQMAKEVL